MDQSIPTSSSLKYGNFFLTEILVAFVLGALLVWYVKFLWNRRKLYQAASKLPGPLALPFIGSSFYFLRNPFDAFDQLCRMFNHYPGLSKLWFGTNIFYLMSDPKYMKPLLANQQALSKMYFYNFAQPLFGQGLLVAPVDKWRKHRKLITPSFNKKNLDAFVKKSEILMSILKKNAGNSDIDILEIMSRCTLDSISETAMGVQIDAQTTNCNFHDWISKVEHILTMRGFNIFYHSDIIFNNSPAGKTFYDCCDRIRSFTKKVITDKRTKYDMSIQHRDEQCDKKEMFQRKSFLDLLIEVNCEQDENLRFTDEDLLDETVTFMITGMDTTASTMCFILTMLGMHQDIQEKVLAEILDVIGPDRKVESTDLPQLEYLEKVIKETLRLFPVTPVLGRCLNEDVNLGDHVLLKGCSVAIGVLMVHRNERYWPDPYKFDPDRFLPEEMAKRPLGCYLPFSLGSRNCIGMQYGMMLMKTTLATILRKYKPHTSYQNVKEIEVEAQVVLRPKNGFKLSIECRP